MQVGWEKSETANRVDSFIWHLRVYKNKLFFEITGHEFELEATTKIDDLKKHILGKLRTENNDSLKTEDLEKVLIFPSDQISFSKLPSLNQWGYPSRLFIQPLLLALYFFENAEI